MQLTMQQLLTSVPALQKLANQSAPIQVAFRLACLLREIQRVVEPYEQIRLKLAEQYGVASGQGQWSIPTERTAEFVSALDPLLREPVRVAVPPITLDDLAFATLSAQEVLAITWLFEQPTEVVS